MSSGSFFDGLQARKDKTGVVFSRSGELCLMYPNEIDIEIHATVNRSPGLPDVPLSPESAKILDESKFEATWSTMQNSRPVQSIVVKISPPRKKKWGAIWIFFIKITDVGVPLTEHLEITASSGEGEQWGQFTKQL
jgi:hypothetical protein